MDNAARALMIAGGILIGLIVISLFVYMLSQVSNIKGQEREQEEIKRNIAWNEEWRAYDKKVLRGNDVLTVLNKATQNNIEYSNDEEYKVNVYVYTNSSCTNTYTLEEVKDLTTNAFKCISMEDTNNTGRIDTIKFCFIK